MRRSILVAGALMAVAGCNESTEPPAANSAANAAAPAKKHPTYCFFKTADTKGWAASRGADGNVAVKGQAHLPDRRYMAALGDAEVEGDKATLWLTMAPNTTGSGAPGDVWDAAATIPASGAVDQVTVLCGKKTVAELSLKKR
ncbi:MAG TPA: hypothetical protein VF079_08370 [Sphingomicrobium sp.]